MRFIFSQALGLESLRKSGCKVRPNGICADVLANEGMDVDGGHEALPREGISEGRAIPGKKMVYEPTKEDLDEHCRSHSLPLPLMVSMLRAGPEHLRHSQTYSEDSG